MKLWNPWYFETYFIYHFLFRKIEWVQMINKLSHVSVVQYWQIFYSFLIFRLSEKCPNTEFFLVRIFLYSEKTFLDTFHAVIHTVSCSVNWHSLPSMKIWFLYHSQIPKFDCYPSVWLLAANNYLPVVMPPKLAK